MAANTLEELFNQLLPTTTSQEVKQILAEIGDHQDIGLNKTFGSMGLFWHPYGNKTSNYSSIGLASKPGRSLTERITNAIDAVIEDRSLKSPSKPESPQAAVNEWFGRPFSTENNGLFNWKYSEGNYDKKVAIVLHQSGIKESPTIDVIDNGLGIQPENFPKTILSLQEGNKITKKFVVGSFGQGGSSTLAFCDYVFIVSRFVDKPEEVSFTVIREFKLGEDYKDDCYSYLALKTENGNITVPSFSRKDGITLYNQEKLRVSELPHGTLVRHYAFRLNNLHAGFSSVEGNLYHYLHCSMFDPLIPFQVMDLRNPDKKAKQEIVKGSRNRLMSLVNKDPELDNSNSELKLYRPISFIKPFGADSACIKVEYWVVFNWKKKGETNETELRSESNALFIQKKHFAVLTMNGQNQGELTIKELLKDLNLDTVAKHMVVHIDATSAPGNVKRQLFTTNRESVKEEFVLESIKQEIRRLLAEDEELKSLENFLVEKEISAVTETTDEEVKNQIVKLLRDAGFTPSAQGDVARQSNKPESEEESTKKTSRPDPPDPKPELPIQTLPYPEVSMFSIVTPKPKMLIRLNGSALVKVETDADSRYKDDIRVKIEPTTLDVSTYIPLSGGRVKWRFRPLETAAVGDIGKIIVTLTKSNGDQLKDEIEFEVVAPVEKPSKIQKGFIPDFEVLPVLPTDEKWKKLWPNINVESDDVKTVAYKAEKLGTKTIVFYSKVFAPLQAMFDKLKDDVNLKKFFETNYKVWIGYHAILQLNSENDETSEPISDEVLEQTKEKERNRVANMQVKQAFESAKLHMTISKQKLSV